MKRIVKVRTFNKDGATDTHLTLDTSKLDKIGYTDGELDEYMKIILTPGRYYRKLSDRIYK